MISVDQLWRAQRPADLPARRGERLAGRGDAYRTLPHPGEGGKGYVFGVVIDQMLVHLVADDDHVVRHGQPSDGRQLTGVEHGPGRVVRRVDQQRLGSRAEGPLELGQVQSEVGPEQADANPNPAGEIDRGSIGVIERLQSDHLITGVDESQDCGCQSLGRAGRDQHLRVGVVVQPVEPCTVVDYGLPQRAIPRPGGYWFTPAEMAARAASNMNSGPSVSGNP